MGSCMSEAFYWLGGFGLLVVFCFFFISKMLLFQIGSELCGFSAGNEFLLLGHAVI